MEFLELAKSRFSCRSFQEKQITKEQLQTILEAGRIALTAKNLQEQRIYVAQSEEAIKKIDEITPCRYGAPTVLLVAYDKTNTFVYPGEKTNSGAEDATIVATHMILAAESVGVNSCWINKFNPDEAAEKFNLPENEEAVMLLDLGYITEGAGPADRHNQRKELSETVTYL